MKSLFGVTLGALLFVTFLSPTAAFASPWTLHRGEIAVVAGYDYQFARQEFLEQGERQNFPLEGQYSASTLTLGLRAGFTDRLEFGLQLPLKLVSYTSDPVILLEDPSMGMSSLDFYQENIIDLGQTRQGIGDVWLSGRYNLLRTALAIAIEARIKIPAGYEGPQGTFGNDPATAADFMERVAELVSPENVSDDVALGDGQVDLNLNLLLGTSFRSRTFMRLDAGYNLRLGAGDQVLGSFKVGQGLGKRVLLYADVRFAYTVTEGEQIGVSVAATDPNLLAADYGGFTNLRLRELRLERDAVDVSFGGIVRIGERSELNVGYARTVWGRNTAAVNAFFIGIGVRTDVADDPAPTPEPEVEEEYEEEDTYEEEEVVYEAEPVQSEAVVGESAQSGVSSGLGSDSSEPESSGVDSGAD
ncbi:MAG: hypothetical protein ACI9KE_000490 [Polyangiales bacterium]|jgi:hypothetical protein